MEEKLLRQQVLAAYRQIAPDHSVRAEFLAHKLASALFAQGVRSSIGLSPPDQKVLIHHSLMADQRLMWVCKRWARVMGYRPHAAIGLHITDILADECHATFPWAWDRLLKDGKIGPVEITLRTSEGRHLQAEGRSEIMRDDRGEFLRTFCRIRVSVPAEILLN